MSYPYEPSGSEVRDNTAQERLEVRTVIADFVYSAARSVKLISTACFLVRTFKEQANVLVPELHV